ncbi:MAG: TlpA family protein disulfide reductase [Hyphomicrobiales bacterium]|nr:TlpA family protein disulfide reductase [Hyphomicrobiales bacterium]
MPALSSRTGLFVAGLALAALGAVLYVRTPHSGKEAGACQASQAALARVKPHETGAVAAAASPARAAPVVLSFAGPDGAPRSIASFAGKTILLNVWATWCVPCREEMPTLAKAQATLGAPNFEVVTVNVDAERLEKKARAFFGEVGAGNMTFYHDAKGEVLPALKQAGRLSGLPTTYLIGPDGCEIATLAGPADWSSADAAALIKAGVGP